MLKELSYTLWSYDVWGNADDGWDVNDRYKQSDNFIIVSSKKIYNQGASQEFSDYVPTDEEIKQALIEQWDLKNDAEIEIDGDGETHYINDAGNGCPICQLELNK